MHVAVQIESESGEVKANFADAGLDPRIISRAPEGGSCLRFIDPYGDLVLNQLQLPELLEELRQIRAASDERDIWRHIDELLSFLEGARDIHTYVRFLGD